MNDSKFRSLVSLYLDKEITADGLELLKHEIASDELRRNEFNRLCRIHLAERKVLMEAMKDRPPVRTRTSIKRQTTVNQQGERRTDVAFSISSTGSLPPIRKRRKPVVVEQPTKKINFQNLIEYGGVAAGVTLLLFISGAWILRHQESGTASAEQSAQNEQNRIDALNYLRGVREAAQQEREKLLFIDPTKSAHLAQAIEELDVLPLEGVEPVDQALASLEFVEPQSFATDYSEIEVDAMRELIDSLADAEFGSEVISSSRPQVIRTSNQSSARDNGFSFQRAEYRFR